MAISAVNIINILNPPARSAGTVLFRAQKIKKDSKQKAQKKSKKVPLN